MPSMQCTAWDRRVTTTQTVLSHWSASLVSLQVRRSCSSLCSITYLLCSTMNRLWASLRYKACIKPKGVLRQPARLPDRQSKQIQL